MNFLIELIFHEVNFFCGSEGACDDLALLVCRFRGKKSEMKDLYLQIPSIEKSVIDLLQNTENILLASGLEQDKKNDILLIVEEAITNIVNHAYKGEDKNISMIEYHLKLISSNNILIELEDKGKQFDFHNTKGSDAKKVLEEDVVGGFGLKLIRTLADTVKYFRLGDKNVLHIEIKI